MAMWERRPRIHAKTAVQNLAITAHRDLPLRRVKNARQDTSAVVVKKTKVFVLREHRPPPAPAAERPKFECTIR